MSSIFNESQKDIKSRIIELRDINLTFGDRKIFDNFNISFDDVPGEPNIYSIVGSSGCGKSTLLRLLAGLQKPESGEIYLYGNKYTDKSTLPMIFQRCSNFPWMTVRENLELPLKFRGLGKEEIQSRVDKILDIIKMKEVADDWAGNNLSGGMHQRLALGRSIINDSQQVILCDEFTSALDALTEDRVINNIRRKGTTCIIVAHRLSTIVDCDRIYVMDKGKVVQEGKHEELYSQEGLYRELISMQ
jgi:ABC-type multidrug transport system fused ATPase/permease subunit